MPWLPLHGATRGIHFSTCAIARVEKWTPLSSSGVTGMIDPLPYLTRIREYYAALGYGAPYRWAAFEDVPFVPLRKPLREARIGVVTTAVRYDPAKGEQGPDAAYNGAAKFFEVYSGGTGSQSLDGHCRACPDNPEAKASQKSAMDRRNKSDDDCGDREPDLRISHIAYDRDHSPATDQASWFPLRALRHLAATGEIGGVAEQFHGLPTNRSHRVTGEVDAPEIVARCVEDGVDAVVLVPNCPVCHQSCAFAANALEAAGIATVVMGCALDIIEHVGVPRLLFSDFPLGNGAGLPHDPGAQLASARMALMMLAGATGPRTTWRSPQVWPGAKDWKQDYSNAALLSAEEIATRRAAFDAAKQAAKTG